VEEALHGAGHRAAEPPAGLGAVRADFERALADPADPAIASVEIASDTPCPRAALSAVSPLAVWAVDVE